MRNLIAITREVSPAFANCELTHLPRVAIDVQTAAAQHAVYERALESLGCTIERIGASADMPDSVFIEDAAVVLDEVAIITRPGAPSRRAETVGVATALARYRPLTRISQPGTMDGGDVMVVGRSIFVGASSRTNLAAIEQMRGMVALLGYSVQPVSVHGCLHLKSAVSALDDHTLLINPAWARADEFRGFKLVVVDPREASAANVVRVKDRLVYSEGYPRTLEHIVRHGFSVTTVDLGEIAKAEGAVTCCSLIFITNKDIHCHSAD
jgi:dimethylargininase